MNYPIRFYRSGGSKAAGFLAYLLVTPLAASFAGLLSGWIVFEGIKASGLTESWATIGAWAVAIPIFVWGIFWAIRDYRRRAFAEVVVFEDRIEIQFGRTKTVASFQEVQDLRTIQNMDNFKYALIMESGEKIAIPHSFVPSEAFFPTIEANLFRFLAERTEKKLQAGEILWLRESRLFAYLRIFRGVFLLTFSPILELRHIPAIVTSRRLIRHGWKGRHGGFGISKKGAFEIGSGTSIPIPWQTLSIESSDLDGIRLRTATGEVLAASPHAEGFMSALSFLKGHLTILPKRNNEGVTRGSPRLGDATMS